MGHVTNIVVINTGIVRNLQKTPYYLRIPQDRQSVEIPTARGTGRTERTGRTIKIPPTEDIELDYKDWKLVENDLIVKDYLKVLKIIRYPYYSAPPSALIVINKYTDLPPAPPAPGTIVWVQYGGYQGIFYYDEVRNEWLSENETTLTWSSSTNTAANSLNLISNSEDTRPDNDFNTKNPISITGMTASQANALELGNATRFVVNTFNKATGVLTPDIVHLDLTTVGDRGVKNTSLNTPVDSGMLISASREKLLGILPVTRPSLTLWYRERLVP